MARGWESKSVESQQADAANRERRTENREPGRVEPVLTDEARRRLQERRTLELALAQTQAELTAACRAPHRDMLHERLKAIRAALDAIS